MSAGCRAPVELHEVATSPGQEGRSGLTLMLRDAERDLGSVRLLIPPGLQPTRAEFFPDRRQVVVDANGLQWIVEAPEDMDERAPAALHVHSDGTRGATARDVLLVDGGVVGTIQATKHKSELRELDPDGAERWLKGEDIAVPATPR